MSFPEYLSLEVCIFRATGPNSSLLLVSLDVWNSSFDSVLFNIISKIQFCPKWHLLQDYKMIFNKAFTLYSYTPIDFF